MNQTFDLLIISNVISVSRKVAPTSLISMN